MSSPTAGEVDRLPELLKAKSREAFDQLYDRYAGALYGFICRTVPDTAKREALLQDVFVRVWKDIDRYDPVKERFFTWLFRLTRNACTVYGQTKEHTKAANP